MRFHLGARRLDDCTIHARADATAVLSELHRGNAGLRREQHTVELDGRDFARAREELLTFRWFPQRVIQPTICADGVTVVQRLRIGPFASIDAPVRVVERVEEPSHVAIAVVTVRGHPERGVERYELVLDPALDRATLTIEKAWELADPLARLGAPFATWLQGHATRLSLRRFGDAAW